MEVWSCFPQIQEQDFLKLVGTIWKESIQEKGT